MCKHVARNLSFNILLTKFIHSAEVDLFSFAALQVEVKRRANKSKPPDFGLLEVQAVFTL